ncbi:MAG: hypothetical protein MZV63_47085 [Marinilabiliales bacterium]|nr:hypothetical protein [Marinilabiliales bacterium]
MSAWYELPYPVPAKRPDGPLSRGVSLAGNRIQAEKIARKIMSTRNGRLEDSGSRSDGWGDCDLRQGVVEKRKDGLYRSLFRA